MGAVPYFLLLGILVFYLAPKINANEVETDYGEISNHNNDFGIRMYNVRKGMFY